MLLAAVNSFRVSSRGANENDSKIIAPSSAINQYGANFILPILILGKNIIDRVTSINVEIEIINVGIINQRLIIYFFT